MTRGEVQEQSTPSMCTKRRQCDT